MKKITTEEILKRIEDTHDNRYTYIDIENKKLKDKITIKCNNCGNIFNQELNAHIKGQGCPECAKKNKAKKLAFTLEQFIEKARKIHGDKYDYSKVNYINSQTKVCIICPEHGEFWQLPNDHIRGQKCPKCSHPSKKYTNEEFIKKLKSIYNNNYDFRYVNYQGANKRIEIVCKKHGKIFCIPKLLLQGKGCPKCGREKCDIRRTSNTLDFIEKARKVHGDKYDYSKVKYINAKTKVCIICTEHGEFWQSPNAHLKGQNCPKCGIINRINKQTYTQEEVIKKAIEIHGNKYDYSKYEYVNYNTKSIVHCKKHNYDFNIAMHQHIDGIGCPLCNNSKLEQQITNILNKNQIKFITQYTKNLQGLRLDFYLPDYNVAIECQGSQHFKPILFSTHMNAENEFLHNIEKDVKKYNICKKLQIKLIYYTNKKIIENLNLNKIYENNLFFDEQTIIKEIKGE